MSDTTSCPYCREVIKVGAIRCKHCQADLRAATGRPGRTAPIADTASVATRPIGATAHMATLRPAPAAPTEGARLGDYVLGPLLGHGAMGMVFRARKERLARDFAIKILAPHLAMDAGLVARFEEEARVQSSLRHPHIVDVVDSIVADGVYAFVMELIEGPSLERVLDDARGRIPLARGLAIMDAVLDAVGYAHEHDVIHRDLKPGNILLARIGGREVVKVADFGLARMLGSRRRTASGATLGTYVYMSPEQCRGDLDVDHRADLYSLGVTLFELATGRPPFEAPSDHAILDAHLRRPPPRPAAVSPAVGPELEAVILRALEKSPEARFQSAAEFRRALAAARVAAPLPAPRRVAPTVTRSGTIPATVAVGATLGHYRLEAELGAGAMGTVFRALDIRFDRPVAIKVLSLEICNVPNVVERLEREATLQAKLTHPNIVAVHELVKEAGISAIVMELVRGRTLEALLEQESPLPPRRAAAIASEILEALDLVHEHAVVHRDLKPGNVMLVAGARRETVKVADFGLALRPSEPRLSQVGSVMGTPLYMSPEQCNGVRDIDGRSDLYAVGVILFEMLTGRLPFAADTVPGLLRAHTSEPPPPPSAFAAGIPPALDEVVLRAMAKRRDDRFATAGAMLDALGRALATPSDMVGAPSEPPIIGVRTTPPPAAKGRWRVIMAALAVGGAGLAAAALVLGSGGGSRAGSARADRGGPGSEAVDAGAVAIGDGAARGSEDDVAPDQAATADGDASIVRLETLADRLCRCPDMACAGQVMKDLSAMKEPSGKPTKAQMDRAMKIAERMADCRKRLMTASGAARGSEDVVITAAAVDAPVVDDRPLLERLTVSNPFVLIGSPPLAVLQDLVSREAYGWFLAGLPQAERGAMRPLAAWDAGADPGLPVTWVTFEQASRFCGAVADGARLPTSAEWSRAARDRGAGVHVTVVSEWTGPAADDGTALVREERDRGHEPQEEFNLYLAARAPKGAKLTAVARADVGFRCVRAQERPR